MADGARTRDLLDHNQALCRLSYGHRSGCRNRTCGYIEGQNLGGHAIRPTRKSPPRSVSAGRRRSSPFLSDGESGEPENNVTSEMTGGVVRDPGFVLHAKDPVPGGHLREDYRARGEWRVGTDLDEVLPSLTVRPSQDEVHIMWFTPIDFCNDHEMRTASELAADGQMPNLNRHRLTSQLLDRRPLIAGVNGALSQSRGGRDVRCRKHVQ